MADETIPDVEIVVAAVVDEPTSPSVVLKALMRDGYSRAVSQRAMQRALDRNRITFNSDLKFIVR